MFFYTSITNIFERPEGIKIASIFILSIVVMSLVSRTLRSTELRVLGVEPDPLAQKFIRQRGRLDGRSTSSPTGLAPESGKSTTPSSARPARRII